MDLLKRLSEAYGAAGREERIRDIIRAEVEGYADTIEEDALGNLICLKRATSAPEGERPRRVMIPCHMDEIAFYVRSVDDRGFVRVHQLGGFDVRNLFARRVVILGREEVIGVMNPSGRPLHIALPEERKKIPRIVDLVVDTGLSKEELDTKIRPGDPVCLKQDFVEMGHLVSGKALDNRASCWAGIRTLQTLESTPFDVYVVFTVQEEVGVRGAPAAAFRIEPDIGVALDTTLAVDIPGIPDEEQVATIGEGVAIKILDSFSISDHRLVERFAELAVEKEIPHQFEVLPLGGTDAGGVQRARMGCKAITLSIPTRYIHTITESLNPADLRATVALLVTFLELGHNV